MKRNLLLVVLMVCFVLTGCFNDGKSDKEASVRWQKLVNLNGEALKVSKVQKRAAGDFMDGAYLTLANLTIKYYSLDYLTKITPTVKSAFLDDITKAVKAQFVFSNRVGSLDDASLTLSDYSVTSTKTKKAETEINTNVYDVEKGVTLTPFGNPIVLNGKPEIVATVKAGPLDKIIFTQYTVDFAVSSTTVQSIKVTVKATGKNVGMSSVNSSGAAIFTSGVLDMSGSLKKTEVYVRINELADNVILLTGCSDSAGKNIIEGTEKELILPVQ